MNDQFNPSFKGSRFRESMAVWLLGCCKLAAPSQPQHKTNQLAVRMTERSSPFLGSNLLSANKPSLSIHFMIQRRDVRRARHS